MRDDFDLRVQAMAEIVVRIGLNLQSGQPLLVTDPYDLQGAHPESAPLIEAIRKKAVGCDVTVITGDPVHLRNLVEADDLAGFEKLISANMRRMKAHLRQGGAFLFLPGSVPRLLAGLPAERVNRFTGAIWQRLGPLIQQLVGGATQWTLVPIPTRTWADAACHQLPESERLSALWERVFQSFRIPNTAEIPQVANDEGLDRWRRHLGSLGHRRDELNRARHRRIRYTGAGTELTLELPRSHRWCTAQLRSKRGVDFVANLPTEEIFTAPKKCSASGRIRLTRPIQLGGDLIEGLELEFHSGRVRTALARTNIDLLQRLMATDDGADRIGEFALVPNQDDLSWGRHFHHHILLDENSTCHIALGEAYRFCSRAWLPLAINSSQIHLDLPLEAKVELL